MTIPIAPVIDDLYAAAVAAGVTPIDHHESDLYLPVTATTADLVTRYQFRANVRTFLAQPDSSMSGLCFDIPFAYTPYWEARR